MTPARAISVLMTMALLSACATTDLSRRSPELVVEGNERSYPAFEAAAAACGYTDYWRFPGVTVEGQNIQPHFNLFRVTTPAARCAARWVDDHPETQLQVSAH